MLKINTITVSGVTNTMRANIVNVFIFFDRFLWSFNNRNNRVLSRKIARIFQAVD